MVPAKLDHHHRQTVAQVFAHPLAHNIQWRDVLCLLERIGDLHECHAGGWAVTVDGSTTSFGRARSRELSSHQVMTLRRLLIGLELAPARTRAA